MILISYTILYVNNNNNNSLSRDAPVYTPLFLHAKEKSEKDICY